MSLPIESAPTISGMNALIIERVLGALGGKVGRAKAYEIIKGKVNQTIVDQHEWLKFDYHQ